MIKKIIIAVGGLLLLYLLVEAATWLTPCPHCRKRFALKATEASSYWTRYECRKCGRFHVTGEK